MAEVSLTIGGVDEEHLRAAGVEVAYNEVTVTRRVFRDGGSEYFINKTPCRLKDIQQLFMGTGVGRTSYSIMAQGNITQILSSKPEDRRMIFEEAAGITKFKAQKKEALRKLEYTEQNLLRVADLIREVKRQIGSLQRQAGKARRYKQIADRVAASRHAARAASIRRAAGRDHASARPRRRSCATRSRPAPAGVLRCEDEITQLRERLSELEHQIGAHAAARAGTEGRDRPAREPDSVQRGAPARIRRAEYQGAVRHHPGRGTARGPPDRNWPRVTERLQASEAALEQHAQTLEAKQEALRQVEEELRRTAGSFAPGAGRRVRRRAGSDAASATKSPRWICRSRATWSGSKSFPRRRFSSKKSARGWRRACSEFAANVEARKAERADRSAARSKQRQARLQAIQEELERRRAEQDQLLRAAGGEAFAPGGAGAIGGDARRLQRRRAGGAQAVATRAWLAGGPDSRAGSITSWRLKMRWAITCNWC